MRDTWFYGLLALGLLALGLPFAMAQDEAPVARFSVSGFTVEGENPLPADTSQAILTDFTGSHEGLDGLLAAADALESAIIAAGHSFHRVVLPPQTLDSGVVTLQVVVFRVGNVTIKGNEHFPDELVRESLPALQAGTAPRARQLSRALRVANQHPARQVGLKFKESETSDTIDAEITVKDEKPWQVVASLNNTGSKDTGRLRLSTAYQHSNVFGLDHTFTASYVTSPENFGGVQQRAVSYQVPLYEYFGRLSAFYVESSVDTGVVDGFGIAGSGRFWGLNFRHQLPRHGSYRHWVSAAFENKFFDNDVTFGGVSLVPDVRSTPFIVSYGGEFPIARGFASYSVAVASNLRYGSKNDAAAYAASRADAEAGWKVLRLRSELDYPLPENWALRGVFEGQLARTPLISGEQFGLGGALSVRGLEERDAVGDDGYRLGFEVWTPPMAHRSRFLGFMDIGKVWRVKAEPGTVTDDFVMTVGLGLRWQPERNVSVAVDWGHALQGTSAAPGVVATGDHHDHIHANVSVRF